jgi:rhamnogalacturonyl hydrolase YesR
MRDSLALATVFNDSHIFRMTDDTGMFQHAKYSVPNLTMGYTTDDNVRALIMAVMLYEKTGKAKYLTLVYRYLAFVLYAQNDQGQFKNFMTYDRQFTENIGSEDCFGRCLWALGYTLASPVMSEGIKNACAAAFACALPQVRSLIWPRGQAYALIGMSLSGRAESTAAIREIADLFAARFDHSSRKSDWQWFEDNLTYDNAVLPWAMFVAYRQTGQEQFLHIAQKSLAFLDHTLFRSGFFCPVGCNGWWQQGSEPALYDQQPVEASMSTLAHVVAYEITGDKTMLELAQRSFAWYLGDNVSKKSMIDVETGGCYDGITSSGVNRNQGAESIVGYCIAQLVLEKCTRQSVEKQ